ncbi:His-Xaa-Ser system radical SAM maturase HxsC [Roseateles chitinivorans]|uniref:His-Xaa-Ser system radical SAM maturase HxsC n=1 Tax=Roseateles chitinivorans TaxID=2917965 RepID=UPI003D66E92C
MRQVRLSEAALVSGVFRVERVSQGTVTLADGRCAVFEVKVVKALALPGLLHSSGLEVGDVVKLDEGQARAIVCFRASDRHHTLFVTNQCNSRCLMCSQPPTPQEDGWLFREAMEIVKLVTAPPAVVGVSGGEPTLHPTRLRALLNLLHLRWPETQVEVLTNGRRLGDEQVARALLEGLPPGRTNWLVPLYAGNDEVHDFVVQSPGAFDETIGGLMNLQQFEQAIQLRTVLIRPVIEGLVEWGRFVGRNLPFVQAVALMATEPIGFALATKDMSVVDVLEYGRELANTVAELELFGLTPVLMNMPLCKVPAPLRAHAAVSISDWKNDFAPECEDCELKPRCSGFFVWDNTAIYRTGLKPVVRGEMGRIHV